MMKLPAGAALCLEKLNSRGYGCWVVGGAVRDSLMGRQIGDVDLATTALPQQTSRILSDYRQIKCGERHGTIAVIVNGEKVEITTRRADGEYSDGRHPDSVQFVTDMRRDCARRDFTVNALCWHPDWELKDFFGGRKDIEDRIIRCIQDPYRRFDEDRLRILRRLRFCSVLGFSMEEDTSAAAIEKAGLLKNISAERIYMELLKMLAGDNIQQVLLDFPQVLGRIIPEIIPMVGLDQRNIHHIYDVWHHTAVAVANTPPIPMLRLAALLHDTGKPDTFTIDEKGVGHFYSHGEKSLEHCRRIMERLKAPGDDTRLVCRLVKYHDTYIEPSEKAVRRRLNKHGEKALRLLMLLKRADNKAQNTKDFDRTREYDRLDELIDKVISQKQCFDLKSLAINGSDLLKAGFCPGPEIGRALKSALEQVIDGQLNNDRRRLLEYVKKFK